MSRLNIKKIAILVSALLIFLVALIPFLFLTYDINQSTPYEQEPLILKTEDDIFISGFKYTPVGIKSEAGIIVAHYFTGTRLNMHPISVELVKRGFTVISIDLRGHGISGGPLLQTNYLFDLKAVLNYFDNNLTHITKIGALGHSYGAGTAEMLAINYPNRINATVSIGWVPSILETVRIRNLMIAHGPFTRDYLQDAVLDVLKSYTGRDDVKFNEMYGDFNAGNATMGLIGSFSEHVFEVRDPAIVYQTVQWFEQEFNGALADDIIISALMIDFYTYFTLFGVVVLVIVTLVYLSTYLFKHNSTYSKKEKLTEFGVVSAAKQVRYFFMPLVFIQLILSIALADYLTDFIPFSTALFIMALIIGSGIGTLVVFNFLLMSNKERYKLSYLPLKIKDMCTPLPGRSVMYGVLSSLILIIPVSLIMHLSGQISIPTAQDIIFMVTIPIIIFPFFLIKEFYLRHIQERLNTSNTYLEYATMVFIGILVENLIIGIIIILGRFNIVFLPLHVIFLMGWLFFSIIHQFFATFIYIHAGRNILGSTVFSCLFFIWMMFVVFRSYGFL